MTEYVTSKNLVKLSFVHRVVLQNEYDIEPTKIDAGILYQLPNRSNFPFGRG